MSDTDNELRALRESMRQLTVATEKLTEELADLNEATRKMALLLGQVAHPGIAVQAT